MWSIYNVILVSSRTHSFAYSFCFYFCLSIYVPSIYLTTHWGFPDGSTGKESACNVGDVGSIPGLRRPPGGGNGYLLQYSGLESSMDCINSQWVTKSWTRRSDFHFSSQISSVQLLSCVRLFATHESQYARPPCPSPTPGVHSDSRPSSQ